MKFMLNLSLRNACRTRGLRRGARPPSQADKRDIRGSIRTGEPYQNEGTTAMFFNCNKLQLSR